MIILPDDPIPVVVEYHRPEKKIEKKIEQRDTIYLITSDWFFPLNFPMYSYPFYGCGGVVYVDSWIPGYGYPSWRGYPLGDVITFSVEASSNIDSVKAAEQDSLLAINNDSIAQDSQTLDVKNTSEEKKLSRSFFRKFRQMKNNRLQRRELRSERREK